MLKMNVNGVPGNLSLAWRLESWNLASTVLLRMAREAPEATPSDPRMGTSWSLALASRSMGTDNSSSKGDDLAGGLIADPGRGASPVRGVRGEQLAPEIGLDDITNDATGAGVIIVVYPGVTLVLVLIWVIIARGLHKARVLV